MRKKITHSDVERVARLARLRLSGEEKEKFRRQLDEILPCVQTYLQETLLLEIYLIVLIVQLINSKN
jgi:hypothetical protein